MRGTSTYSISSQKLQAVNNEVRHKTLTFEQLLMHAYQRCLVCKGLKRMRTQVLAIALMFRTLTTTKILQTPSLDHILSYSVLGCSLTYHQNAMRIIGLSDHEQSEIFRMLATILWLGNVQFVEDDSGNSTIADAGVTDFVAYLLEVDSALVQKVMTIRVMETQRGGRRGSVYDVPLNPAQATSGRDALAKAIYNNLFEWIVSRINVSMKPRSAHAHIIGILVSSRNIGL